MNFHLRRPFQLLFLVFVILGVFYPSIFAGSLSTDDYGMIQKFINNDEFNWIKLFLPGQGRYYYRPVTILSYYISFLLHDCHPWMMHFENVVIHVCNSVLVFFLLHYQFNFDNHFQHDSGAAPLLIGIFYGIHPLVTESVSWISGRTDLLACFFVLCSFYIFQGNIHQKKRRDCVAALFFLFGLFSKEVAIGLLPVLLFVIWQKKPVSAIKDLAIYPKRMIPFIVALLIYVFLRTNGSLLDDAGVVTAIQGRHGAELNSLFLKISSIIKAIGFYFRKLLWPFPLNFAIIEINRPFCLALGLSVLLGSIPIFYFGKKKNLLGFIWIISFLLPALPVAVNKVAWTPLAERYLYVSIVGLCFLLGEFFAVVKNRIFYVIFTFILICYGSVTAQRNIVWQTNESLWKDVITKSPNFALGHNDYGLVMLRQGKMEEAEKHFQIASSLTHGNAKTLADSNLSLTDDDADRQIGKLEELYSLASPQRLKVDILSKLVSKLNAAVSETEDVDARKKLLQLSLKFQTEWYAIDRNTYHQYRIGQLYLALGEREAAQRSFTEVCAESDSYYTEAACKLSRKLLDQKNN